MTNQALSLQINDISAWVDRSLADKDPESILWHRVGKVGEEHGEAIEALIGATNGNPRKPGSHTLDDLRHELLDTALAALCAWAHMSGNAANPIGALAGHARLVHARAGLTRSGIGVVHVDVSTVGMDGMVRPACSCGEINWGGYTTPEIADAIRLEHITP